MKYKKAQYKNMAKFIGESALQAQYDEIVEDKVDEAEVRRIVSTAFDKADNDGNDEITLVCFPIYSVRPLKVSLTCRLFGVAGRVGPMGQPLQGHAPANA